MRISDWSVDVCSSDLVSVQSIRAGSTLTLEPQPRPRYTETVNGQRVETAREWGARGKALPRKGQKASRPAHHQDIDMLSLFQRKRPPVAAAPSPAPAVDLPKGLMRPESAASLLATPRRQKLMRSEEHPSELQSIMRHSSPALSLKKKK